ncbi:MAG TPA: hypothetical protein PKK61_04190 [Defluviitaleaceae bacterium]|nr:hypothetical protein [Defluviitaleaceae bacterium]
MYRVIEIHNNELLIENEHGTKFLATLNWFARNFIITPNPKAEIISCGYQLIKEPPFTNLEKDANLERKSQHYKQ